MCTYLQLNFKRERRFILVVVTIARNLATFVESTFVAPFLSPQPLLSQLTSFVNSYQPLLQTSPLLSTQSSPVLSTISTTYVATDEVTTFVNKARPLLSTVMLFPIYECYAQSQFEVIS